MRRLKILTWHIHGSYLLYLTQVPHEFYLPVKSTNEPGYGGRCGTNPWGPNVHEVPAESVRDLELDCIIYQWRDHYFRDQYDLLSDTQRRLPRMYIEHDPPQQHPTFTRHPVQDPNTLLIHVTPYNALMWDNGVTPSTIIEHGVRVPESVQYIGNLPVGIVVVNHLMSRGRRLGSDIFTYVHERIPLDLVGMGAEEISGIGEVLLKDLPAFESHYRFFFHPARYTSLGLAVCEAMMIGMPIVGLATTELSTVIQNGVSGFIDTRIDRLIDGMKRLLSDPMEARDLGRGAQRRAKERFDIGRFVRDWSRVLQETTGHGEGISMGASS